jgi:hypothetical protein
LPYTGKLLRLMADWRHSAGIFADSDNISRLRSEKAADWTLIGALAVKLLLVGTITGADGYELLLLRLG